MIGFMDAVRVIDQVSVNGKGASGLCPCHSVNDQRRVRIVLGPKAEAVFQTPECECRHATILQEVAARLRSGYAPKVSVNGRQAPDVPEQAADIRPAVRGYTARDLQKMVIPAQRWAVPKIIPQGLTILAGGQKKGKSRLLYDTSIAIASGGVALGCVPVEQGEVLYLALEDNDRRLQERLEQILGDEPAPEDLHIYPDWPSISGGGLVELKTWIEAHPRTRLVAIDTLGAFRSGMTSSRNSGVYQEDYELGRSLLRLAIDYSLSMLVAHHTNKKEDWEDWSHGVSGSVGLTGASDATLLFERARGSSEARLRGTGRDVEDFDLALSWDETANVWVMMGEFEDTHKSPERFEIIELLSSKGPLPPKDVSDMLEKNHTTTKNLLLKMFRDGEVTRKGGKYSIPEKKVEG